MSIAKTLGSSVGSAAAYSKHAVLATGLHGGTFIGDFVAEVAVGYAAKDAELAVRRDELRAAREARAVAIPVAKRARKLATA